MDAFAHRGPDGRECWVDDELGVAFGHRRLAILDLSPSGVQPVHSKSTRWVLTFNGAIYNYRELRAELEAAGTRFAGSGDAEVLVEGIDAWGVAGTLRRANGMFAFGAWDRANQRLTIARDRMGEKPLYWSGNERRFAFASELKGLLTLPWLDRTIDRAAVSSVLRWGFVAHPRSMFSTTQQLAPGQMLEVQRGADRLAISGPRAWWSLAAAVSAGEWQRRTTTTVANAARELAPILAAAVACRLHSDVPLGSFLSGGVDSSLVAALAQRELGSTPLHTFSAKIVDLGVDESQSAAEFAQRLGARHTTVEVQVGTALAAIPSLASTWDEPLGDPSMIPTLLLCRVASQELSVCLGGDGGDELFAGYNRHALGATIAARTRWLPQSARSGVGRALGAVPHDWIDATTRRLQPVLPSRWLVDPATKAHKLGALLSGDESTWPALAGIWPHRDDAPAPAEAPPGLDPVEQLLWADTTMVLPDNMLVKVDRASMAYALEVRSPFLDPAVVEWSWCQPLAAKSDGGVGKVVLRQLLRDLGHPDVAQRPKVGFDPPLAAWLRGPLRPWASDLVSSSRAVADGYLGENDVSRVWREHQRGHRNNEYQLWALLMLESWFAEHGR